MKAMSCEGKFCGWKVSGGGVLELGLRDVIFGGGLAPWSWANETLYHDEDLNRGLTSLLVSSPTEPGLSN